MWESKTVQTIIPDPVVNYVEQDVRFFVEQELIIYKQNPDNTRLDNSVIVNIALFDLHALKYENGVEQINNLFSDHNSQVVSKRLKQLLHTLYIRYGIEIIDNLAEKVLVSMEKIYGLNGAVLSAIDKQHNTFWLQPFIRNAYSEILYGNDEEDNEQ